MKFIYWAVALFALAEARGGPRAGTEKPESVDIGKRQADEASAVIPEDVTSSPPDNSEVLEATTDDD
jgi:hypothetical protein